MGWVRGFGMKIFFFHFINRFYEVGSLLFKDSSLYKRQVLEHLFHEYVAIHFNTSHWCWQ